MFCMASTTECKRPTVAPDPQAAWVDPRRMRHGTAGPFEPGSESDPCTGPGKSCCQLGDRRDISAVLRAYPCPGGHTLPASEATTRTWRSAEWNSGGTVRPSQELKHEDTVVRVADRYRV